ncbi:MAG: FG-GAP repeat domain-containing protein, partial [Flavobacteriales bacterium]
MLNITLKWHKNILLHPAFLALLITLLIIPFLPRVYRKYVAEVADSQYDARSLHCFSVHTFNDLDKDGCSEDILMTKGQPSYLIIYDNKGGVLDQINFANPLAGGDAAVCFGDVDGDGLNEMYCFTQNDARIYLQQVDVHKTADAGLSFHKLPTVYVDSMWINKNWVPGSDGANKYDGGIYASCIRDMDGDGKSELLFAIGTAFSCQPRNMYLYDPEEDSIYKSPESGSSYSNRPGPDIVDLNGDGLPELIYGTRATGNLPADFPYSDSSAWLMALNHKMHFLFPPLEFPLFNSFTQAVPYRTQDGFCIAVLYNYFGIKDRRPALYLYSRNGKRLAERPLPPEAKGRSLQLLSTPRKARDRLFLIDEKGMVSEISQQLDTLAQHHFEPLFLNQTYQLDADGDGLAENL